MTLNLKSLAIEYFEEDNSRKPQYYISIGRDTLKEANTANVYRFSKGIVSRYNLDDYTHCKLGFNEQFQVITFTFVKRKDGQKIPPWFLKLTRDKNIRKISGLKFARKWQINNDQYAGKYPYHERSTGNAGLELAIILTEKNKIQ